jgi:nucleotidyltransferase substrate binding protein (TIGR01987 family)
MPDVRWKQRFQNFQRALKAMTQAVELAGARPLSELERQGLIQSFEFTHELAWNTMKDYLEYQGITGLIGSRDSTREAFKRGLIEQGEEWMKMIKARNLTSHTYNLEIAEAIVNDILQQFYPAFKTFAEKFVTLAQECRE